MSVGTAQLAAFRTAQLGSMTLACSVRSQGTPVRDGHGTSTPGTVTNVTTVCRRAPTTGVEFQIAGLLTSKTSYTFTLPHNTIITTGHQIVVGSSVYDVVAVLEGGTFITALRVLAVEVDA